MYVFFVSIKIRINVLKFEKFISVGLPARRGGGRRIVGSERQRAVKGLGLHRVLLKQTIRLPGWHKGDRQAHQRGSAGEPGQDPVSEGSVTDGGATEWWGEET